MEHMATPTNNSHESHWLTLPAFTVAVGITSGLCGMGLGLLLRFIQHRTFGYRLHLFVSNESFLEGVTAASPSRRLVALCACGVIAGIGWWALSRFGRPLVSIGNAVKDSESRMPLLSTILHDLLQIVTAALGSPLGREIAPRECGAVVASWLSDRVGLSTENRRIMIACGAGAGLAAVYNVPLSGALFTLEVLLGTLAFSAAMPAIATSSIAAIVAWIGLGDARQYSLPNLVISPSLILWSIVTGPLFGWSAYWFVRAAGAVHARAPQDWRRLTWCAAVFPLIGLIAVIFPQILGNGKGLAQAAFDNDLGPGLAAALLILKVIVTLGALRAGTAGGLLTPGLAVGASLASILGALWNHVWPGEPVGAFAIVGSAAFLASSMTMPFTAIALMLEFTRVSLDFLVPISLAVVGSICVFHLCADRDVQLTWKTRHDDIFLRTAGPLLKTQLVKQQV
jgi:H+/Cl- antiporter ClcA